MELFIRNMNKRMANDILNWKYDKPYDFYNNEVTDESMKEILDGSYYALVDEFKELIGFFALGKMLKYLSEIDLVFIQKI